MTNQEILAYVNADTTQAMIRSALETLISVPSVSQDAPAPHIFGDASAEALDRMLEIADKLGFETENHDYYCGSVLMPGEDPSDEIGIIAHLDVVPAVEGWRHPRFALTVENGLYIGRGVRDDKGPAVAALAAMYFFKEKHIRLPFTVRLLLGCDEERGMGDLPHFLASHAAPRFSFSPDSVFPVCVGEKGIAEIEINLGALDAGLLSLKGGIVSNAVADTAEAVLDPSLAEQLRALALPANITLSDRDGKPCLSAAGKSAHAAEPDGSVNAIVLLAAFLLDSQLLPAESASAQALRFLCGTMVDNHGTGLNIAVSDAATGKLSCVCGMAFMRAGQLIMDCNIRYPASYDTFDPLFARISAAASAAGYQASFLSGSTGYVFSPEKPEIAALTAAFSDMTGLDANPYTMGGGTYARSFPNTVAFGAAVTEIETALGPGCGGAHERDECVRIEEFNQSAAVFIRALLNLAAL